MHAKNTWLSATAHALEDAGVAYQIVIAGRTPAPTYGREYFSSVRIKLNSKNQAGPAWLSFLRKAGLKTIPYEYKAAWEGGIFRYRYTNAAKTVYVFAQCRPDIAEHGKPAGWAGDIVVLVTDESNLRFGVVRSALVASSRAGVPKSRSRRTRDQMLMEDMLEHNYAPGDTEPQAYSHNDKEAMLHARTLQALRLGVGNKHIGSLSEYGALYAKYRKQAEAELSGKQATAGSTQNTNTRSTAMGKAIVIAGFPGIGKSFLFKHKNIKAADSDSSLFSWVTVDGVRKRNPDFPKNYIEHIQKASRKNDVVLVSTHADVRKALDAAGICYALVYPEQSCKQEYIDRYVGRDSPETFCKMMSEKFNDFVAECMDHSSPEAHHYQLKKHQFLSTVLDDILEEMPNSIVEYEAATKN